MTTRSRQNRRLSDRDLMLFVDGELDPARRTDVQSSIDSDPIARRKVAALRLGADLVRDRKDDLGAADGIAAAVMARIASGDMPDVSERDAAEPPPDKVVPLRPKPVEPATDAPRPAANDNSRRIYYLAAAAVAAAAALMVWARNDPGQGTDARPITAQTAPMREVPLSASTDSPQRGSDETPSPEGDLDVGVEVAAVDFGARQGSIFYVPNGAAEAHTTTVVWLDDSAGDE